MSLLSLTYGNDELFGDDDSVILQIIVSCSGDPGSHMLNLWYPVL